MTSKSCTWQARHRTRVHEKSRNPWGFRLGLPLQENATIADWWRWAESNRRPKELHPRHYMLSSLFDLDLRQHDVRSTPSATPALC